MIDMNEKFEIKFKAKMRAQASIELLITIGIVLAFTIPVLFLLLTVSQFGFENASLAQGEGSAKKIADNINEAYLQGADTKRIILVNLPSNTELLDIQGNEVVIKVRTSAGEYEAVSPIFGNVTGFVPIIKKSGTLPLVLTTNADGEVEISG